MGQRKKIVAIMFTGLANYPQLVKQDKKLALEILSEHDKMLKEIIQTNYGNIIKHINESKILTIISFLTCDKLSEFSSQCSDHNSLELITLCIIIDNLN